MQSPLASKTVEEVVLKITLCNDNDVFFPPLVAPRFPVSPAPVFVLKGHTAFIECKPESNPPPVITWLRDGLSLAGSGHQYIVDNVQPADEGSYTCNVKNSRGSTQGLVQLSIGSKSLGCLFHVLGARLRAVSLFCWSVEQNARDTQMTTRVTEGASPRFSRLAASPLNARAGVHSPH